MDNTVPVVRFVKCPKCLEILAELPEIPVYKCGGCGTILRAKSRSRIEQNLSSVPVNPAPQNSGDSDLKVYDSTRDNICEEKSLRHEQNESKELVSDFNGNPAPQNSGDSDLKISDSSRDNICEEKSLKHEQNEIKDLVVSDLNGNPAPQNSGDSDLKVYDSTRDNICEEKSLRHEQNESKELVSDFNGNPATQNSGESDLKISDSSRDNICEEKSLKHEQNEIKDLVVSNFNSNPAPQNSVDSDLKISDSSRDNICEEKSLRYEQNETKDLVVSDFNGNPTPQNSSGDSDLKISDSSRDNISKEKSLKHEQNEIKDLVVSDFNGNLAPQNSGDCDLKVYDSSRDNISKEKSLKHEQNEIKDLVASDLNVEIHEAKREPLGLEGTNNKEILEEDNEELEESLEPMVNADNSEDMFNMEFGNGFHFGMTSRSSPPAYEASVSSTEEDRKDHIFRLSRRTFRNKNTSSSTVSTNSGEIRLHSAANGKLSSIHNLHAIVQDSLFTSQTVQQNWIESENPANDTEVNINQISSEQYNQVKILSRVDELRNELRGLFNETTNNKESSFLDMKASQFREKIPSKEYRSSLIPFSRQHSSSCFHNCSENRCCHNEHCRPCPHNICCHQEPPNPQIKASTTQNTVHLCRPVSGGAPFVICYKCFRLLQLPADFLVTPKRVNNLRCGGCSQVLKYFFRPRSQSMPQTPVEDQHPPSEENDTADGNLASRYNDVTAWDPISSSESNSSEVEPVLHKSRSLDENVEEGEGGCFNGLKLHSLMGYSSATELLFSNGYSHDEC